MKTEKLSLLLKYLFQHHKLSNNFEIFNKSLIIHPDYPSLNSLSDTFDDFYINNIAIQINPNQLSEIIYPAIAHCHSEKEYYFVLLKSFSNNEINYISGKKKITTSVNDFSKIWKGVVLLISPNENPNNNIYEEINKKKDMQKVENYVFQGILLCLSILALWMSSNVMNASVLFTLLIGLLASIFLLQNEFGKPNELISQFCHAGKYTDCDSIVKSSSSKLFNWLSWSEIGLFYFAGCTLGFLIALLSGKQNNFLYLVYILNALALPYTFFSVYYQAFVIKKWCILCLFVQVSLWLTFMLLFKYFTNKQMIDFQTIEILLVGFFIPVAIWFLIKPTFINLKRLTKLEKFSSKYYRNSELFVSFLQKQRKVETNSFPKEIIFGNLNAKLEILIICGVFCKPCAQAHHELNNIVSYYGDELKLIIRFLPDKNPKSNIDNFIGKLLSLEASKQEEAINFWYKTMDYDLWKAKYSVKLGTGIDEILNLNYNWCQSAEIIHTPTIFINGNELKQPYSYLDLKYHIRYSIEKMDD